MQKLWRIKVRAGNWQFGVKKSLKSYFYRVNQIDQIGFFPDVGYKFQF